MSDGATSIEVVDFLALTIGIIVFFTGTILTRRISILRDYNIPEPVSGGLIAALLALLIYVIFDISISYELDTRDQLLVYFFTAIGLNARFDDLVKDPSLSCVDSPSPYWNSSEFNVLGS